MLLKALVKVVGEALAAFPSSPHSGVTGKDINQVITGAAGWSPVTWRSREAKQQPVYPDGPRLEAVLGRIRNYPPLVFAGEVDQLRKQLSEAASGKRFLLQGGDCAERFQDCTPEGITNKLKILLQMSVILCYGARRPVIRVGRIAGQYAKPRSDDFETIDGVRLPVYRGDNINSFDANPASRQMDPDRLLQAYHCSSLTLNYLRAMISGGFADLHHPEHWNLSFLSKSAHKSKYQKIVANIQDAIAFMESLGGVREEALGSVEFYTSHEGLVLGFEEAMTRFVPERDRYYNLGAHMLWIGERTRQLDGAHIEYFRGIANPIGVKIGPSSKAEDVVALLKMLNPSGELGRMTLISRCGQDKVSAALPPIVEAVKLAGLPVVWSVDPMHGNMIKTKNNIKTRDFDAILSELRTTVEVHKKAGTSLGGVHFELTGDDVTECVGGAENIKEENLLSHYETYCDPRLNYSQSLEMAFLLSTMI